MICSLEFFVIVHPLPDADVRRFLIKPAASDGLQQLRMMFFLEALFETTVRFLEKDLKSKLASDEKLPEEWLTWLNASRDDFYKIVVSAAEAVSQACLCTCLCKSYQYDRNMMHIISRKYVPRSFETLSNLTSRVKQTITSSATLDHDAKSLRKAGQDLLDLLYERGHHKPFFICFDEAHTLTVKLLETHEKTALGHLEWALSHLRRLKSGPPKTSESSLGMPTSDSTSSDEFNLKKSNSDSTSSQDPGSPKPQPGRIFTLFMSTTSDMDDLAMSAERHPSHRVHPETILFPPITELPFDVFASDIGIEGPPTLETVSQLKNAAKFGRPL